MVGLKVTLFLFLFHTHIAKLSVNMLAAYLCLTFCDLMNCSPPDSSVHGTLQAGILEWVAVTEYALSKYVCACMHIRLWFSCLTVAAFEIQFNLFI